MRRSAISSSLKYSSASECSAPISSQRSARYCGKTGTPSFRPTCSTMSRLGKSVAAKNRCCAVPCHSMRKGSTSSSVCRYVSRLSFSCMRSLSTLSFEAGATLLLLTIPNPFGVRTRSSEGMALTKASETMTWQQSRLASLSSSAMACAVSSPRMSFFIQCSARTRKGIILSLSGISPSTESKALGKNVRKADSDLTNVIASHLS